MRTIRSSSKTIIWNSMYRFFALHLQSARRGHVLLKLITLGLLFMSLVMPSDSTLFAQEANGAADDNALHVTFTVEHPAKTVVGNVVNLHPARPHLRSNGCLRPDVPYAITFPVTDMHTGNRNRDSHMLEVLKYPVYKQINVKITQITCPSESNQQYRLDGEITIAGVTHAFATRLDFTQNADDSVSVSGNFPVLLSDYNLEAPSLLFMSIEDRIQINFDWRIPRSSE